MVSAWASRQRLVSGQERCDEKENEIPAIPRLLECLELTGALVTIDARGCRIKPASKLKEKQRPGTMITLNQPSKARHDLFQAIALHLRVIICCSCAILLVKAMF